MIIKIIEIMKFDQIGSFIFIFNIIYIVNNRNVMRSKIFSGMPKKQLRDSLFLLINVKSSCL